MKHLIPPSFKVSLKIAQRYLADFFTGELSKFTNFELVIDRQKNLFQTQIKISQPIFATSHSENKKHNLNLAIQRIQNVLILPGKIFSFWHLVGNPNSVNGYQSGRVISGDRVKAEVGGGLCQLSGSLYLLALKAGLTILERHPHSQDIYTEATRFAPLGADATVVYGYKDFRFQNNFPFPICFRFAIEPEEIRTSLCAEQLIPELNIEFKSEEFMHTIKVDTIRWPIDRNDFEVLNSSTYKKLIDHPIDHE